MPLAIDPATDMLGIIDVQPDFMPGGALPVADGDAVVPVINRLLAGPFKHAFASQDWHPADHASFASRHPGRAAFEQIALPYGPQTLWPDHCVQGTAGAALHPDLEQARVELIVRKGFRRDVDSYSAFTENDRTTGTGLDGWLRARGVTRVFFVGLALDVCVAFSAEDAARLGFESFLITDACRGIGGGATAAALARLAAAGVQMIESEALV